jgi:hypothetical protein
VIGDFHTVGVGLSPFKANPPLIVDSYTELSERVPLSDSSLFPGTTASALRVVAALSICSFLIAKLAKF